MKDYFIWVCEKLEKKFPHMKWQTICEAVLDYPGPLTGEYSVESYLREVKNG